MVYKIERTYPLLQYPSYSIFILPIVLSCSTKYLLLCGLILCNTMYYQLKATSLSYQKYTYYIPLSLTVYYIYHICMKNYIEQTYIEIRYKQGISIKKNYFIDGSKLASEIPQPRNYPSRNFVFR